MAHNTNDTNLGVKPKSGCGKYKEICKKYVKNIL